MSLSLARSLRRANALALLGALLVLALGGWWAGPALLSPGPLSQAHAPIGDDCGQCHTAPLRGVRALWGTQAHRETNAACVSCHRHNLAMDRIHSAPKHAGDASTTRDLACADCHLEHDGAEDLQAVVDAACVDCHGALEPAITRFAEGGDHPSFTPTERTSALRFDHATHVTAGMQRCTDCHDTLSPTGGHERGAYMQPTRFEAHCERCHALTVPLGEDALGVPHGSLAEVRATLEAAAAERGAAEETLEGSLRALRAPEGPCWTCHEPAEDSAAVRPVSAAGRRLEDARFNHGAHTTIGWSVGRHERDGECQACHAGVLADAGPALPKMSVCLECHGDEVSGACSTCHGFHEAAPERSHPPLSDDPERVARGEEETRFGTRRGTPYWPIRAFFELPAEVWGRPDIEPGSPEFHDEVFARYGLFEDPQDPDGLPMGLTRCDTLEGDEPAIVMTCEFCHSSVLFDQTVRGQPNRFSSMQDLFRDMAEVSTIDAGDPLYLWNPPQNSVVNAADQLGLLGLVIHQSDLAMDVVTGLRIQQEAAMYLKPEFDALAFLKTPPWYLFRTKLDGAAGYYYDGGHPKDGNFAAFTYLAGFHALDGDAVREALSDWAEHGPSWLATLEAPAWPFALDAELAAEGRQLYDQTCADCHGHYAGPVASAESLVYPGRVLPKDEVGTDPLRADFPASYAERVREVLRDDFRVTGGYVATPLNGIWARAPYLHNGSVPTLWALLTPEERPERWALLADPRRTEDYLTDQVGWRFAPLAEGERSDHNRVHDPSVVPGLGNQGHTFGAELSEAQRLALLEFLKTL